MTNFYLSINKIICVFDTFMPPIYTSSLAEKIIVCTPSHGTDKEKHSRNEPQQLNKGWNADSGGK